MTAGEHTTREAAGEIPWATVVVFASAGFFTMTTSLMTAGLLPAMARDFSVSEGLAGSLTSVFAIAIVFTVLPMTQWSLRYSRRNVVVATVGMLVLSNVIVAMAPALPVALIGRFIGGMAHGLLSSAIPATVIRMVGPRNAPQAMGIALAGNSAGLAVGAPLTAILGASFGWRGAFVVAAVVGIGIAVALYRVVPSIQIEVARSTSIRDTVRLPGVLRMSTSWAIVLLGHYAVLTFIAPIFLDLGGTEATLSLPLLVVGVTGMAGVLLAGRLPLATAFRGAVAASVVVAIAFLGLWLQPPLTVVYAMLVLWGAGSAASLLLNQQCVLLAGHRAPEMAMGLGLLVTQLGIAVGAAVGGVTLQTLGTRYVPFVGSAVIAISLVILAGMPHILRAALRDQAHGTR